MAEKEINYAFNGQGITVNESSSTLCVNLDTISIVENRKRLLGNSWYHIPKSLLLSVFQYLGASDLMRAGQTCSTWHHASIDELLWRDLLKVDFSVDTSVGLMPGKTSWYSEYKRLSNHTPFYLTSELREHSDQVLHVSFSHDGSMFVTCSKDGYVVVWNTKHPVSTRYKQDMKIFGWKLTHFSQFNQSDTLLLVSGVRFGSSQSTCGEIAVFSLGEHLEMWCQNRMEPYDICGAWYSDQHFLSGDIHQLGFGHLVSQSFLWLNEASQTEGPEFTPSMIKMSKFFNCNGSSIRAAMFARCPVLGGDENSNSDSKIQSASSNSKLAHYNEDKSPPEEDLSKCSHNRCLEETKKTSRLGYDSFSNERPNSFEVEDETVKEESEFDSKEGSEASKSKYSEDGDLCVDEDKFLIFTTGLTTFTPHQIGIKRIKPISFPRRMGPGSEYGERGLEDTTDYDEVDHLIDLYGQIVGIGLSPDNRYLFVNVRPWPLGTIIENPLVPPPCAQEIEIHVIDITCMQEVGKVLRSHIAYSPANECFFISLNVCNEYVASGAEDKHGYLWDRHYEVCLNKYPHQDVVNSVAFNPIDSEMLVTVSDDSTVRVWLSKHRTKDLKLDCNSLLKAREVRSSCCGHKTVRGRYHRTSNTYRYLPT